jgi:hypothetical protein
MRPKIRKKETVVLDLQARKSFIEVLSKEKYVCKEKMSYPGSRTLELLFTKSRRSPVDRAIYGTRTHDLLFTKQLLYQLS